MSSTPVDIRWRGSTYHVRYSVFDNEIAVEVKPENIELQELVLGDVKQSNLKLLSVYKAFAGDCLTCDPRRGD